MQDLYSKQISIITDFPQAMEHSLFFDGQILQSLMERNVEKAAKNLQAHIEDVKKAIIENSDSS